MRAVVERVTGTPTERLAALLAESERQGVACVRRLVQEWSSGDNRFDRPGEALYVATTPGGDVVGVCGLSVDPYAEDPRVGRLRHLYVRVASRRSGIGEQLVADVVEAARGWFDRLHLRVTDPTAARLFERMGFRPASGGPHHTHVLAFG